MRRLYLCIRQYMVILAFCAKINALKMQKAKNILIVGTGGIGCELAKLLSVSTPCKMTLIDFDNIELSNLNRQFMFTNEDIGKPKSEILHNRLKEITNCDVTYINDNVYNYDAYFFKQFDVVYNCLDNNEARSYVNVRCFLMKTLLIDGGSGGYKGQSYVFDYTKECFDCLPKPTTQLYNVCTIRSVPTKFEHCIEYIRSTVLDDGLDYEGLSKMTNERFYEEFISKTVEVQSTDSTRHVNKDHKESNRAKQLIRELLKSKNDKGKMHRLLYKLSCIRAKSAGISCDGFMEFETIWQNIIPSICTTNSMVASLMILSETHRTNYFITLADKCFIQVEPSEKNHGCACCSKKWILVKYKEGGLLNDFYGFLRSKYNIVCKYLVLDTNIIYSTFQPNLFSVLDVKSNVTGVVGYNIDESMNIYFVASGDSYSIEDSIEI